MLHVFLNKDNLDETKWQDRLKIDENYPFFS